MNYANLLRQRAKHAEFVVNETADSLAERNTQALLAWRQRWYLRRPHIDPWAGVGMAREWFDWYLLRKRLAAQEWLAARRYMRRIGPSSAAASSPASNVIVWRKP